MNGRKNRGNERRKCIENMNLLLIWMTGRIEKTRDEMRWWMISDMNERRDRENERGGKKSIKMNLLIIWMTGTIEEMNEEKWKNKEDELSNDMYERRKEK